MRKGSKEKWTLLEDKNILSNLLLSFLKLLFTKFQGATSLNLSIDFYHATIEKLGDFGFLEFINKTLRIPIILLRINANIGVPLTRIRDAISEVYHAAIGIIT